MSRRWLLLLALALAPVASFAATGQEGSSAAFRVLDKQTNRLNRFVVDVKTAAPQVPFSLQVGRCVKNVGGVPGQDAAWLDISAKDGKDGAEATFSGWMFNSFPDVATFDHPRYDVQLVGCDTTADEKAPAILPEIKVQDEPVRDDEAPAAAQPAQQGAATAPVTDNGQPDPYYVPGVEAQTVVTTQPEQPAPVVDNSVPPEAPAAEKPESQEELHKMMEGM